MVIYFNPRENGACPMCTKNAACPIRQALAKSVADIPSGGAGGMEVVVYACPAFREKS